MSSTDATPLPFVGLRELAELLVRHYGLTEGQYDLQINYQVGSGMFGPSNEHALPSIAVGLQQVGLAPTTSPNVHTIDAATVPQAKVNKPKRKRSTD